MHNLLTYTLMFLASFFFIFLKAWQQLNVVHKQYLWIVPTSMAMAVCEVWVVYNVARNGWGWSVLVVGIGSGLGALLACWWHHTLRKTKV